MMAAAKCTTPAGVRGTARLCDACLRPTRAGIVTPPLCLCPGCHEGFSTRYGGVKRLAEESVANGYPREEWSW